ncbi:aspartic proteinase Asp1-like [Tasmannia lanceolata]|uniref:aspartic proteinase Asp1-like n=1 Tax=Tasmannia lanceolata TaxID=3420 RepID=UPI004064961F
MGRKVCWKVILVMMIMAMAFPSRCSAAANKQEQPNNNKQKSTSSTPISKPIKPSSVVFPIKGKVYPDGLYYAELKIGEPPKPYFLDIDTGSDLTWLQCNAPCVHCSPNLPHPLYKPSKQKLVPCDDPICAALTSPQNHVCENPKDQCDYEIEYADQGSSLGVLVKDAFSLRFANGSLLQPHLAFGCGYDQQNPADQISPTKTDGVLGLGNGKASIVSQLRDKGLTRNVIGHCLSGRGGGYLFIGDDYVPSSGVTWTPMSRNLLHKHYSAGAVDLALGKQPIGNIQLVFDSGSSYTYFASGPYQAFISALRKDLSGKPLKETFDESLPQCWRGAKKFISIVEVKKYFNPLVLTFAKNKKAQLEIPPEGYLIVTSHGNVCLGILNGTQIGLQDNIIGDISFQDLIVIYDNENQKIGWARANCDRLPNMDDVDDDSYMEGFSQPHVTNMGVLTEEFTAPMFSKQANVKRRLQ